MNDVHVSKAADISGCFTNRLLPAIALLLTLIATRSYADAAARVTCDFAVPADYPLVKDKFGVFNSGMVRPDRYLRDSPLYGEVKPDSIRVDLGWGAPWIGWKTQPITGTPDHLAIDFSEMDQIAGLVRDQGTLAYWSYCYMPAPLQSKPGDYRCKPVDLDAWGSLLQQFAVHYRQFPGGNPVAYQEVCNEPDNKDFFDGTREDYLAMYRSGALGIRAGDPDAQVGGPALAFNRAWIEPFLKQVVTQRLPLDFFSFHFYPGDRPYGKSDLDGAVKVIRDSLDAHPQLATVEIHLNEFNAYPINYPQGGKQDRAPMAVAFLDSVSYFLTQPFLTHVFWAQFQDSGHHNYSGMISLDGHRKAIFNAYVLYNRMPIDRRQCTSDDAAIRGFAAADEHRSAAIVWNTSSESKQVTLNLAGLASAGGMTRVYRIDADHASWGDRPDREQLEPTEPDRPLAGTSAEWNTTIPGNGIYYVEVNTSPAAAETSHDPPGKMVRELHYYPDRSRRSYAEFDRRTWTARLGTGGESSGLSLVGITAEQLAPMIAVEINNEGGPLPLDSMQAIRIDYQTTTGYARSVLFHTPSDGFAKFNTASGPTFAWGTTRAADDVVSVKDFRVFSIEPKTYAPAGWTGRVQISFVLYNGTPTTHATFSLSASHA